MKTVDGSLAHVRELIAAEPGSDAGAGIAGWLRRLCLAAARALPASAVAVSLVTDTRSLATVAASDPTSGLLEEVQLMLGEGPCLDAFATGRPVLVPDLGEVVATRWPGFVPAAQGRGVRAVFAFPLQVGAARLGALDVFRAQPGALSGGALTEAFAFAEIATTTVLDGQAGAAAGRTPAGLDDALESQFRIHQAQGMVMVQLQVSLAEALVRLRAYAYAHDLRLGDVARDVIDRRLTLTRDVR